MTTFSEYTKHILEMCEANDHDLLRILKKFINFIDLPRYDAKRINNEKVDKITGGKYSEVSFRFPKMIDFSEPDYTIDDFYSEILQKYVYPYAKNLNTYLKEYPSLDRDEAKRKVREIKAKIKKYQDAEITLEDLGYYNLSNTVKIIYFDKGLEVFMNYKDYTIPNEIKPNRKLYLENLFGEYIIFIEIVLPTFKEYFKSTGIKDKNRINYNEIFKEVRKEHIFMDNYLENGYPAYQIIISMLLRIGGDLDDLNKMYKMEIVDSLGDKNILLIADSIAEGSKSFAQKVSESLSKSPLEKFLKARDVTFAENFLSITVRGKTYDLSPVRAQIIQHLANSLMEGREYVTSKELLSIIQRPKDEPAERLDDYFKNKKGKEIKRDLLITHRNGPMRGYVKLNI
ncbi:MAG: hypothetical protein H6627_10790 [Calditrichae bacterium]|nr:hypothetical protein [Calditrichia bacterium]